MGYLHGFFFLVFPLKKKEKNLRSKCCFLLLPMKYCWIVSISVSFSVISILFNAIEDSNVVYFNDWFEKEMKTEKENVKRRRRQRTMYRILCVFSLLFLKQISAAWRFVAFFYRFQARKPYFHRYWRFCAFYFISIQNIRSTSTYYINIYSHW